MGDAIDGLQGLLGRALLYGFNVLLAFVPRRRPHYPRQILRTAAVEEGRRRRLGLVGMAGVAGILAARHAAWPACRRSRRPMPSRAPWWRARRSRRPIG